MWTYQQSTGKLSQTGRLQATGFAGRDDGATGVKGFNNPELQGSNCGPLPQGFYTVNAPQDTNNHGAYVLWLSPHPDNEMFGRFGFGLHGAIHQNPLLSSEGSIVVPMFIRERVWDSNDHSLKVIA